MTTNTHFRDDTLRRKAEWVGWAIVIGLMWALPFAGNAPPEREPELEAVDVVEPIALTHVSHNSDVF